MEKALTKNGSRLAISYLTLDDSDMILVLLCKRYKDGMDILDGFHREEEASPLKDCGLNLVYSFTVAAIQKESLNTNLQAVAAEQKDNIDQAYIYIIEKNPKSIEYVYDEMKKQILCGTGKGNIENIHDIVKGVEEDFQKNIKKESVLGCNDEVIVVKDIPWEVFLKFFQDQKGVLNSSSPVYEKNLVGVTTIISHSQKKIELKQAKETGGDSPLLLSSKLRKMMKKLRPDKEYTRPFENISRYLYQIINSLQKFEESPFRDYTLISALLPLNMVIQISEEVNDKEDGKAAREFFSSFYEFIRGLNIYIHNAVYSDHQFAQTINYDFRIYNSPVKVIAFYNAFIYCLKNYLDLSKNEEKEKHEYEFLLCVGVAGNMEVQELFQNMTDTKRLFLVNIPEDQAYNPKQMLIMLGHEVGHFVGQEIRSRKKRVEHVINIMAKIMVSYFRDNLEEQVGVRMSGRNFAVPRRTNIGRGWKKNGQTLLNSIWRNVVIRII